MYYYDRKATVFSFVARSISDIVSRILKLLLNILLLYILATIA